MRLPSGPEEFATVTATVTDPAIPGPTNVTSVPIRVTVRHVSLGPSFKKEIEEAVVEAARKTGVPPQFLKAQIDRENSFKRDTLYRYEPLTQDFSYIGSDAASGRGEFYRQRHMFAGGAASGDQSVCVALVGEGVDVAAVNQVCGNRVDVKAGVTTVDIHEPSIVRARTGSAPRPAPSPWRTGQPEASLQWNPVVPGQAPRAPGALDYVDPPHETYNCRKSRAA